MTSYCEVTNNIYLVTMTTCHCVFYDGCCPKMHLEH